MRVTRIDSAHGPFSIQLDESHLVDGGHVIERAGIDVPRVVVLRQVLEGLQLVAASALSESFEV